MKEVFEYFSKGRICSRNNYARHKVPFRKVSHIMVPLIHYSYLAFILLLLSLSLLLSVSLSLLLLLSLLSLPLSLQLPSISSTKYFWLLSLLGDHNENKVFLPILCYPRHFVFFSSYIKKMLLFIFYIKYSNFTIYYFFSYTFNQELTILLHFLLYNFCIFFYQWRNMTYLLSSSVTAFVLVKTHKYKIAKN